MFAIRNIVFLFALCAFFLIGCRSDEEPKKPTKEECIQSYRNFIRLMAGPGKAKELLKKTQQTDHLAGHCVKKRERQEVLCEIKAQSLEEMRNCRKKRQ